jgi:hypothetical protein
MWIFPCLGPDSIVFMHDLFGNVLMFLIPMLKQMIDFWMEITGTGLTMEFGNLTHFSAKFDATPTSYKRN